MAITVAQLRTFLAVAQAGSVKGAAAELVVTQPSVSSALAALERELGVRVVERRGRGIRLSAAGEAFAPFAARVMGFLEEGRNAACEAAEQEFRELRISAVTTCGEYIVPPLIRAFRQSNEKVRVQLQVGNRAGVIHQTRLREADIGIGGTPPQNGEFEGFPFLDNQLVVIVSPEDPLAQRRQVPFKDLERCMWLLRESGSGTRIFVQKLLAERGIKPHTTTIGSNGAIKQAVRVGLGISIQSRQAVVLELAMGMLRELDLIDELPWRKWYAVYPAWSGYRRPVVEEFLEFLKSDAARDAISDSNIVPVK
jgi:DNA-binding transcriptional LysR family regulator